MTNDHVGNGLTRFDAILEFLRRPEVTGNCKKIPPLYLRKNLLATAGNLKVN